MHAETWRRVDLDNAASELQRGFRNVRGQEVDACDVEADDGRRPAGDHGIDGMDEFSAIDRDAAR